ncbi:MAG: iron-containing alcohol dehydrogenase [Candidatus Heimdallarchaeaceae archaeon]
MDSNNSLVPKYLQIFDKIENVDIYKILEQIPLKSTNPLIIFDNYTFKFIEELNLNSFENYSKEELPNNKIATLDVLIDEYQNSNNDLIFSVGGGTISDAGKYISKKLNIPMFSFPTTVSNDGITSPISVLYGENNEKKSMGTKLPDAICLIMEIIQNSPMNLIRSGIGDLISNITAVWDWRLSMKVNNESYNEYASSIALNAAYSTFYFVQNIDSKDFDAKDAEFLDLLTRGLLVSGLAMSINGTSRPCSGSEHEISHAMDQYKGGISNHGIQVALGTLFTSYLQNNQFPEFIDFNHKTKLPLSYSDLNLKMDEFIEILKLAPTTRANRYTILEHLNLNQQEYEEKLSDWDKIIEESVSK